VLGWRQGKQVILRQQEYMLGRITEKDWWRTFESQGISLTKRVCHIKKVGAYGIILFIFD